MSYVNEVFPGEVAKGALGGPVLSMSVTEAEGGGQDRARRWPSFRWEYEAGIGIRDLTFLDQVYAHNLAVGPENSFPFVDINDFTSRSDNRSDPTTTPGSGLDQVIGVGDGTNQTFQLIKTYQFGTRSYVRNIRKPQVLPINTVVLSVAGTLKTIGTDYSLDSSTGIIFINVAPSNGQTVRASFKYYVAVFYGATFKYKLSRDAVQGGRLVELSLVEDVGASAVTPQFPYLGGGETITVSSNLLYDYNWGLAPGLLPTADGFSITLPDINELPFGGPILTFVNLAISGPKTITFKNRATGASEATMAFTKSVIFCVRKDGSGARQWMAVQP